MTQEEIKINCRGAFVKSDQVVLPRELKLKHLKQIGVAEDISHYWPIFKKFYAKVVEKLEVKLTIIIFMMLVPAMLHPAEFRPDPVREHIERYGSGIDPVYCAEHKAKNKQLKRKNFESRGKR